MVPFKHILVPTDFSESANCALDWAIFLASKFESNVTLLHASWLPLMAYAGYEGLSRARPGYGAATLPSVTRTTLPLCGSQNQACPTSSVTAQCAPEALGLSAIREMPPLASTPKTLRVWPAA